MKIALLHYHLRPGGVTTVIRHQIAALSNDCDLMVLSGEPPPVPPAVPFVCIPGLGYDAAEPQQLPPRRIARQVAHAIRATWPGGCDVLHIHNPLLAKNRQFLKIIRALQDLGIPLFLQVHDFAEDGRPAAYYVDDEYPADCHYGVINTRDYNVLIRAGLIPAGLHKLFNMVNPLKTTVEKTTPKRLIVYPIRAIRRKNIGEALLLSRYFQKDQLLAITLPPTSPTDRHCHAEWKAFSAARGLKALFEATTLYDFAALVGAADTLITTSIAEGFGFAFLEPWTAGRGLVGRKLPEICTDFEKAGVQLDHLYSALSIPLSWIDESAFSARWRSCLAKNARKMGIRIGPETLRTGYAAMTQNGTLDFGGMDEAFQQQVIDRVISDPAAHRRLLDLNPFLFRLTDPSGLDDRIENNRQAVLHHYDADAYREQLLAAYHHVAKEPVRQRISKRILAESFFRPENFHLLKWGKADV